MKYNVSFFLPVYNDEKTIVNIVNKAINLIKPITDKFELLIINDGSSDNSLKVATDLSNKFSFIKVITHFENLGYGAAIKTGIINSKYEIICMVDGDDEYDIYDLVRMLSLLNYYDLIIAFRYKKLYSTLRSFISYIYNKILRFFFDTHFRDISTGIRVFRKDILAEFDLHSNSPFIGAELAIKTMFSGRPVGEIGIQTFPRSFGKSSVLTLRNILLTINDLFKIKKEIFSDKYQLPKSRSRIKI
jgi:glycosyltransferase involved in cell wall biosynthesis